VTSSAPIPRSVVDTVARFDGYIAAATPIIVVIRSITGRRSQSEDGAIVKTIMAIPSRQNGGARQDWRLRARPQTLMRGFSRTSSGRKTRAVCVLVTKTGHMLRATGEEDVRYTRPVGRPFCGRWKWRA
jgi:hypothetical protein